MNFNIEVLRNLIILSNKNKRGHANLYLHTNKMSQTSTLNIRPLEAENTWN